MKYFLTKINAGVSAFLMVGTLLLSEKSVLAQVKVGDHPQTINPGSALEIESTNKGLLLPRVSLGNTQSWQLDGEAVEGMQVYNSNPNIFTEVTNYPVIPGGVGVYYWDGNGWVPQKFTTGDYDWLRNSDNSFPSNPADIANAIFHGGSSDQEVGVRTTETGIGRSAKLTTAAGYGAANAVMASFFAENSQLYGKVAGLETTSNHPIVFRTTGDNNVASERMRIASNGSIGIGTTNPVPNSALHVANVGPIYHTSASTLIGSDAGMVTEYGKLRIIRKAAFGESPRLWLADDFLVDYNAGISYEKNLISGGAMLFSVTPAGHKEIQKNALMIANSTGFVGVNLINTAPEYALDVRGDINASGDIKIAGMSVTSDFRLKTDIEPVKNGLEIVSKLNPVSYRKKESISSSDYKKSEIGFIAQEVQKILPQLIHEGKDADKTLAMDYNSLIPVLTKAIQEQQKQIEMLLSERNIQSAELTEIKAMLKMSAKAGGPSVSK